MIAFLKKLYRDRRGNALVIAAAALPLVLGSAGLASDTIEWALWKRQLQRAADSAAMAGVYAKIQGQNYSAAVNTDLAKNNHVGITTAVTPNSPPPSGAYSADPQAVRVSLAVQKQLSFTSLFMAAAPTITASATATIVPSGQYCVVSLENTAATGINATGSTEVNLGCGMITNSISMSAAVATGSSEVVASPIAAVGGIPASTHWGPGTVLQPFTVAQDDPFAHVNPTPPGGACANDPNVSPNETAALTPGCYKALTIKGTANLAPGVYYIDGGDVTFNSQANINGPDGVTFVLSNSNASPTAPIGTIDMNGGANLNIVAPSSGNYMGIMFYQDRRATSGNIVKINGNSGSTIQGALYFPRAAFTFNGNTGMNTNCMQMVAKNVAFTGNSAINNTCPANSGSSSFAGKKVRVVE